MTDFDKLIKEKAEQADYPCKPAAWKRFQRLTGKGSGLKYWVAGTVSAVVVGGAVLTAVHLAPNRHPSAEKSLHSGISDTVLAEDVLTAASVTAVASSEFQPVAGTDNGSPARCQNGGKAADPVRKPASKAVTDSTKPSKVQPARWGRTVVIDVDTIKDNVPSDEELRNGNSRIF